MCNIRVPYTVRRNKLGLFVLYTNRTNTKIWLEVFDDDGMAEVDADYVRHSKPVEEGAAVDIVRLWKDQMSTAVRPLEFVPTSFRDIMRSVRY